MEPVHSPPASGKRPAASVGELTPLTPPGIDLRLLECFVAVAEELHFGRAAARLGIAQPGLSRALRVLEQRLDVQLLRRTSRTVDMTPAGRALLELSRDLLARHRVLVREMGRLSGSARMGLSIAVDSAFAGLLLAGAIRDFRAGVPDSGPIDLRWARHGSDAESLLDGEADLALVGVAPSAPGIVSAVLATTERVVLVGASHPLAARSSVTLAQLAGEPELYARNAGSRWNETWSIAGIAGQGRSSEQTFDRFEDALDLVAACRGIIVAPATAEERHGRPDLCWLALEDVDPVEIHLAWRTACSAPGVGEFIATVGRLATPQGREHGQADERTSGGRRRPFRGYGIIVP